MSYKEAIETVDISWTEPYSPSTPPPDKSDLATLVGFIALVVAILIIISL